MKFNTIEKYNAVIVEVKEDLTADPSGVQFSKLIKENLDANKKNFIVDLSKVKYVNSSGIGMLLSGYTSVMNAGGVLMLADINEKMKGLLSITRLSTIFKLYDNVEDALNSLKQKV
jgi:anti-sigma B factor antagonist